MTYCTVFELQLALAEKAPGAHFIDVRTPEEYTEEHITGFVNVPVGSPHDSSMYGSGPVYVHCHTHRRAQRVAKELSTIGVENVIVVNMCIVAWLMAGYPVVRGEE